MDGRLVDVAERVDLEPAPLQLERGQVHPDRAVAGARGVDRHRGLEGRGEQAVGRSTQRRRSAVEVAAHLVMELRRPHRPRERLARDQLAIEGVGVEQGRIIEDDVVDPDDVVLAEEVVIQVRAALVQGEVEGVVGVVIEVGAGGDDPVDEPRPDQGDQAAHAEPGGGQRPGDRQPDRASGLEHLPREDPADLAQPAGVVAQERLVDQVGGQVAPRAPRGARSDAG